MIVYFEGHAMSVDVARRDGFVTGMMRCIRTACLASHQAAVWPADVHRYGTCSKCREASCTFTPHPNQP